VIAKLKVDVLPPPGQSKFLAVLTWCDSLHKQSAKAAADVSKAHQLVILLLARGGGLSGLAATLWIVRGPRCCARSQQVQDIFESSVSDSLGLASWPSLSWSNLMQGRLMQGRPMQMSRVSWAATHACMAVAIRLAQSPAISDCADRIFHIAVCTHQS